MRIKIVVHTEIGVSTLSKKNRNNINPLQRAPTQTQNNSIKQRQNTKNWSQDAILILVGICMFSTDSSNIYELFFIGIGLIALFFKLLFAGNPAESFIKWVLISQKDKHFLKVIVYFITIVVCYLQFIQLHNGITDMSIPFNKYSIARIIIAVRIAQNIFASVTLLQYIKHAQNVQMKYTITSKIDWEHLSSLLFLLLQTIVAYAIFIYKPHSHTSLIDFIGLAYFISLFFIIEIFVIYNFLSIQHISKGTPISVSSIIPRKAVMCLAVFFVLLIIDDLLQGHSISKPIAFSFLFSIVAYQFIRIHIEKNFKQKKTKRNLYALSNALCVVFMIFIMAPIITDVRLPSTFPHYSFDAILFGEADIDKPASLLHILFTTYLKVANG